MRVAERGQHTAQIGGNILHNEGKGHILALTGGSQHQGSQGQESQQRHIVGDQHRSNKGDIHQRQNADPGVFAEFYNVSCQHIEIPHISKGANHCQHTEKAGQGLKIKVVYVFSIHRHEDRCENCRKKGDHHHSIFADKSHYFACQVLTSRFSTRPILLL